MILVGLSNVDFTKNHHVRVTKIREPVPDQRLSRKSASADKCATSSNLSASGQHGISAPIKPVARPGRRTGKPGGDAEGGPVPFPSAPLSEVEEFHWDPILPGFGIRSQKSGKRVYFVQYRERGRTRRLMSTPRRDRSCANLRRTLRQMF